MALDVVVVIGVGGMGEAIARRQGSGRHLVIGDFNTATLDAVEARLLADGFGVTALQVVWAIWRPYRTLRTPRPHSGRSPR